MSTISTEAFVDALREHRLLEPGQLDELTTDLQGRFSDPTAFAQEMLGRGWLTPYQVEQLLAARGQDLLLGPYILLDRLGEGGMGQVFQAYQRRLGRTVAVKTIRQDRLRHPGAVHRFQREIRAAAQLNHPNIIHIHDADRAGEIYFFVMEYVVGTDLHQLVERHGPLPAVQACDYIRQAALGLQHAHEHGLIHRDIKPANLLLSTKGSIIKVLDMGLALLHQDDARRQTSSELTQEGTAMGTVDYMAPEQALDAHGVDTRADIYSLGCTLYHLLAGYPPFSGGTMAQKLLWHQQVDPAGIEHDRADLPEALPGVLRKMIAKRPEDRYQVPAEVVIALAGMAGVTFSARGAPVSPVRPGVAGLGANEPRPSGRSASSRHANPAMLATHQPPAPPVSSRAAETTGVGAAPRSPAPARAAATVVEGASVTSRQAMMPPARKPRTPGPLWWWVAAWSTVACVLCALLVWWVAHGLQKQLAGDVPAPTRAPEANPTKPWPVPAPAAATALPDQGVNIVKDNNSYHVKAFPYEADIEPDGCLTSLRVGGVEFLRPNVLSSRGAYFHQRGTEASLSLTEIDQPAANVVRARGEKASITYECGTDSLVWTATNLSDEEMAFYIVFSSAVTAVANDHHEFARTPVAKTWPTTTWFAGGSKVQITRGTGMRPWVDQAQLWELALAPKESRKLELKISDTSPLEAALVADVTGAKPDREGGALARQVAIKKQDDERRVTTPKYEAVVEADGCLTHLRAADMELLLAGHNTLSRGSYFIDEKDKAGPFVKLATIEQPESNVLVAKGDQVSLRYEFDAETLRLTLKNERDRELHFFIVFSQAVTAVKNEQDEWAKTPTRARPWPQTAWFAGDVKLKITGGTQIWGPWEKKSQVWDCLLGKGETRTVVLEVSRPSPEEATRSAQIAPLAKPVVEPDLALASPSNYQVFQRQSHLQGKIQVNGHVKPACDRVVARLSGTSLQGKLPGRWQKLAFKSSTRNFEGELAAGAGGWYVLDVRAFDGKKLVARARVDKVGVGEVLITAGQSNAANYGKPRQTPQDDRVAAMSEEGWQLAADPQPLAQGDGGSPWPVLGDLLVKELQVPIGFVSVGVGGTSVQQWQPNGLLYPALKKVLKHLGPNGARCVLWHQGESDTVAGTSTSTYADRLLHVIKRSRLDAGYDLKWFIAGASYIGREHGPKQAAILAGQRRVCDGKRTLAGPTTDNLQDDNRWDGVHLSDKGLKEHARRWKDFLMQTVFKEEQVK
ncbi:MAG TPA: protein kinase [Gemmataceae bacterium]|nr:protein kinase [Gemmataceae bacterium]